MVNQCKLWKSGTLSLFSHQRSANLSHNMIPVSVQFSHSVVSDSLWPHESQYTRPPCPSSTPRVYSNTCPSSRWCHPAISSSVISFFSCPQSLPVSGSFPMSQLFAWGGQSIGVSASASVLPMNTQYTPSQMAKMEQNKMKQNRKKQMLTECKNQNTPLLLVQV